LWLRMCLLNIHLHDTLHHTFAFINIHLDIHRIIIIITYTLASALKEKASAKRKKGNFMLRYVRKEGKVFFAFGSKILISSTSKHFIHEWKGKNILQGMYKVHEVKFNYIILYTSYYMSFLSYFYRLLELRQYSWSFVFLLRSLSFGFIILYVSIISKIQIQRKR
jgi:hypothetical protein